MKWATNLENIFRKTSRLKELQQKPVPELGSVTGWKQHPIEECGEELVPMGPFSDYTQIFSDSIYFGERKESSPYELGELKGALLTPFVRKDVARRLAQAASLLPEGHALMLLDCYRTIEVQKSLFDFYVNKLVTQQGYKPEDAEVEAQRFVSKPSTDPVKPSPHNTGGSVDLTIVKFSPEAWKKLKVLDTDLQSHDWHVVYRAEMERQRLLREESQPLIMGTMFDEVSPATAMRYFEEQAKVRPLDEYEQECLKNRRMFCNIMMQAGFAPYEEEPWHFDYGNQFWAIKNGVPARYGAAKLSRMNVEHEMMRQGHFAGNMRFQGDSRVHMPLHPDVALVDFVRETAEETGSITYSSHPCAHKL